MIKNYFIIFSTIFIFVSCGYKASSSYIQNVFDKSIFVEVKVDGAEPENASFLKDELNRMIYIRFKGNVVSKKEAKNHIKVSYEGSSFTPLAYKNGYVTHYRVGIKVHFDMLNREGNISKTITNIVDRDIQASSLTFSTLRTQAIKRGLEKSLDEFLAYVSANGALKN